jgi:glycosyltransferase involved in cell wall biosynthesis
MMIEDQKAKNPGPLVSIVTPVHNTAAYLGDCIRSVLAQSYPTWEYIIVNNACTDGSLEIAESFAASDPRIRIVNTDQLLPQIVNYNFALRQMSPASRYCKMVQADDWIYPGCVEQMVALAETDPEIAIVGSYRIAAGFVLDPGLECDGPRNLTSVVAGREIGRRYLINRNYLLGSATTLLYRSNLVRGRHPFFPEFKYSGYFDDAHLGFDVLERAKFGFVHQILSYTRVGNPSVMTAVGDFNFVDLTYYMIMKKYGARYLTPAEYKEYFTQAQQQYYEFLGYSAFKRRGSRFWDYHKKGLEVSGERLDWGRIARMQFPRLLHLLGNPKNALTALWHRVASIRSKRRKTATNQAG